MKEPCAISPHAGKLATGSMLADIPSLVTAYYTKIPNARITSQRIAFGTSGHRGSSRNTAFNEWHILAIAQAICQYRKQEQINGPLFLGMDTHALSVPAHASALEVLAANGVEVMIADGTAFTPTPVISNAIITYNRGRKVGLADGIVITPSHNPPHDGGFKYNPPHGGPAESAVTEWIQDRANEFLEYELNGVSRISLNRAIAASSTHRYDYRSAYISDIVHVLDVEAICSAGIRMGVDPLGGAGVHYWGPIAERYGFDLTITNEAVDPTFRFMTVDWDGQIRMDPSSSYAMAPLIGLKHNFDIAFACDTDHDRHGIVTASEGLVTPNHYLTVAANYLFGHRPQWSAGAGIGTTVATSQMLSRVASKWQRATREMPVGFKWFVPGLDDGSLAFTGEESAGASLDRTDGCVWTTDKDGIVLALLAGEITATMGRDPSALYQEITAECGRSFCDRLSVAATPEQKALLGRLTPSQVHLTTLAGEPVQHILVNAPGNGAPIGGIKVAASSGWFWARPSGTEALYKVYAESFLSEDHLRQLMTEAQEIVNQTLAGSDNSQPARIERPKTPH